MSGDLVPKRAWQQGPDGRMHEVIIYERPIYVVPAPEQPIPMPEQYGERSYPVQSHEVRYPEPYRHPPVPKKRRKTRGLAWKTLALFVCSWIPVGMGWPGLTILAWGLIGVWLFRHATKKG